MKALIQFKKVYRPYSGSFTGVRLQAAIPNTAAKKMIPSERGFMATNKEVPSFRAPYLITESMDFPNRAEISKDDVERFVGNLMFLGYSEFEIIQEAKRD